jgi:1-acyl-sn-glycerol-3-phosphate acyltransferase
LNALDIRVAVQGSMPADGLIVSNHLSYLDILCYSSIAPCIFVSKSEVRRWPVFGRLATNGGTIYVDRKSKTDAHRVAQEMAEALTSGVRVVLFPEGTSSGGEDVLRFHAPLFEPAVQEGFAITPAALLYEMKHGDPAQDICYWGDMTFGTHFLKLLSKGNIIARIAIGNSRVGLSDRKQASMNLRKDVVELHGHLKEEIACAGRRE